MRCPQCAGEILDGSRFCGICGRPIGEADARTPTAPPALTPSLFELPVAPRARLARVLVVLALDLVLAGAGIAMIASYLSARERAQAHSAPTSAPGADSAGAPASGGKPLQTGTR